ncbi:putative nicotinamide-nucleotide adenylyltransferase, partial [Nadsonia fulvescens var. elongata DSM 6958]
MDPTLAPDFVPPSEQEPYSRVPRTMPAKLIPNAAPILPYVLADYSEELDAPPADIVRCSTRKPTADLEQKSSRSESTDNVSQLELPNVEESLKLDRFTILEPPGARKPSSPAKSPYLADAEGARPILNSADLEEVPEGISRQAKKMEDYRFPVHRLASTMLDETKSPLVIVACGSFSPITYLHLRMFEMAMDSIREQTRFEVIGGYYSPVSDNYNKAGLADASHRVRMCELACERTSSWLMVDAWESLQLTYQRTALVLDHFNEEINLKRNGVFMPNGKRKAVKIMLLAGGDLIESFGEPNVWADQDLHTILGNYGCLIVERTGSDVRSFLLSHDIMYEHRRNILVVKQLIYNDISSTKVRLFLRRGMSVQYLLPNSVIRYIFEHNLYIGETEPLKQVL